MTHKCRFLLDKDNYISATMRHRHKFEGLFDYLDEKLSENDCDDTNNLTKEYLNGIGLENSENVLEWLREHNGYCDCEILANVEELFE
jgi:hypothetical protein